MAQVDIHEAKTQLSRLVRRVQAGEEVVIASAGKSVARLVPIEQPPRRLIGLDRGRFKVPEAFYAPLPLDMPAECDK